MSKAGDTAARSAPGRGGFKFHVGTAELRKAGRNGGRRRHGETLVYIEGRPVSLQRIAAETGLTVERLAERAHSARKRGEPITLEMLRHPLRDYRRPKALR